MSRWVNVVFVAAWAAAFGLAVAAFDTAASGHDTAALVCVLAFVAVHVIGLGWLIGNAIRP